MDKLENLFSEYESCFGKLDFQTMATFYSDSFMSAGPKGNITESKKQFLQKAREFSRYYQKAGMQSAKILSRYELSISDDYSMVTIHWGLTFKKTGEQKVEFDITYIIQKIGDEPKIIMMITHQDEEEKMRSLGIEQR